MQVSTVVVWAQVLPIKIIGLTNLRFFKSPGSSQLWVLFGTLTQEARIVGMSSHSSSVIFVYMSYRILLSLGKLIC